ncbi:hypothetical protein B0T13DRAFT_90135 [Neurospora crassa]|nr:hypothetical protein B0T13DRAFT_90135 [Neurospora crassa]
MKTSKKLLHFGIYYSTFPKPSSKCKRSLLVSRCFLPNPHSNQAQAISPSSKYIRLGQPKHLTILYPYMSSVFSRRSYYICAFSVASLLLHTPSYSESLFFTQFCPSSPSSIFLGYYIRVALSLPTHHGHVMSCHALDIHTISISSQPEPLIITDKENYKEAKDKNQSSTKPSTTKSNTPSQGFHYANKCVCVYVRACVFRNFKVSHMQKTPPNPMPE